MKKILSLALLTSLTILPAKSTKAEQIHYEPLTNELYITVEKEDSLKSIANNMGHSYLWLFSQIKNSFKGNPDVIIPGDGFTINKDGYHPNFDVTAHYVDKDETLDSIAKQRNVDANWLYQRNKRAIGDDPSKLSIGKEIVIDWNLNPPKYTNN